MTTLNPRTRCFRLLIISTTAMLLLAPLAHAKKRKGDRGKHGSRSEVGHPHGGHDDRGRGTGGIPAVLRKLEEIQKQLEQNQGEIAQIRSQVETLDANVTPCTLQRFRDGMCGTDNHPLDLLVSVCGGVGTNAGLALKYAFTSNLDVQVGVGWKDAPDVHIVENAQIPAILTFGPVPVVLPSELAAQVDAGVSLGLDGCLAPIRVPIGKQLAEPTVLAILENLEAQAQPIADSLVAQLDKGSGGGAGGGGAAIGLARLGNALTAADGLRDQEIMDDNPMAAFGRGPIGDLADSLPIGERLASILDDPEQLALPGFGGGEGAGAGGGTLVPSGIAGDVCSGPLSGRLGPLCTFLETRIPGVDRVLDLVPAIEIIPNIVNDAVDGVRELLGPLFSDAGETASNTLSRFCNSTLGRRRLFDGLCGR